MVSSTFVRSAGLFSTLFSIQANAGASGSGTTTRYWDCCKPSCAWSGKADVTAPVKTCDIKDSPLTDAAAVNGCGGGTAYMCSDQSPWAVNSTLAYGFAAVNIAGGSESSWCSACYALKFTSGGAVGKTMIVQATNTGGDLGSNQFDLAIPGGGVGIFNGCTAEWGAPSSGWGAQYGGISSATACSSFPAKLKPGCDWRFDWFGGADNPTVDFTQVACPAEILAKTGSKRNDDSSMPNVVGSVSGSVSSSAAPAVSTSKAATSSKAPAVSSSKAPVVSSAAPVSSSYSAPAVPSKASSSSTPVKAASTPGLTVNPSSTMATVIKTISKSACPASSSASASAVSNASAAAKYAQCGGTGWTGPTICMATSHDISSPPNFDAPASGSELREKRKAFKEAGKGIYADDDPVSLRGYRRIKWYFHQEPWEILRTPALAPFEPSYYHPTLLDSLGNLGELIELSPSQYNRKKVLASVGEAAGEITLSQPITGLPRYELRRALVDAIDSVIHGLHEPSNRKRRRFTSATTSNPTSQPKRVRQLPAPITEAREDVDQPQLGAQSAEPLPAHHEQRGGTLDPVIKLEDDLNHVIATTAELRLRILPPSQDTPPQEKYLAQAQYYTALHQWTVQSERLEVVAADATALSSQLGRRETELDQAIAIIEMEGAKFAENRRAVAIQNETDEASRAALNSRLGFTVSERFWKSFQSNVEMELRDLDRTSIEAEKRYLKVIRKKEKNVADSAKMAELMQKIDTLKKELDTPIDKSVKMERLA
ncbi:hypothetical protein FKW77_010037 [Venturia effusa]|uniref:Cellulase n=1 Tax=Venturia effusa TaxID=50376 RepID=A0A517LA24_9PEZI|nr:hypothetical protein FKW77_010037 [Venturia effusa]